MQIVCIFTVENQYRIITCVLPECLKLPSNSDTSAPLPQEPLTLGEDQRRVELSATKTLKTGVRVRAVNEQTNWTGKLISQYVTVVSPSLQF